MLSPAERPSGAMLQTSRLASNLLVFQVLSPAKERSKMSTTVEKDYLSCAETAKLVRVALKEKFPGVKFSVRSSTYSGGASIRVGWVDGPTAKDVESVTRRYTGGIVTARGQPDFDGMIDLKTYNDSWLSPDGTAQLAHARGTESSRGSLPEIITSPPSPDARLVSFGADYIFADREISAEWREEILSEFERVIGRPLPRDNYYSEQVPLAVDRTSGELYHMVESEQDHLSDIFHRYVATRSH